ncbi:MAG: hypothetical protein QW416_07960 [Candidatus Nitrosocaldaceae archaeon]
MVESKDSSNLSVSYTIIVYDKDGKEVERREGVSKSFVANFLRFIRLLMAFSAPDATVPIIDIGNLTLNARRGDVENLSITRIPVNGIIIGSGTLTPTPNDYHLASVYGSTIFNFSAHTISDIIITGNETKFTIQRDFTNIDVSPQTVTEAGIIADVSDGTTISSALILRDTFSPITVNPQSTVRVIYTIKTIT